MVEDLFAVVNNGGEFTFTFLRELGDGELGRWLAAQKLFESLTAGSEFAALMEARIRFSASVDALEVSSPAFFPSAAALVQSSFKAWLSAFRSFDDRTAAWLSGLPEGRPDMFRCFKVSLSAEYDANFAYRLCATLRNASEHAGEVINDVSATRRGAPDGSAVTEARLSFDGSRLADAFPKLKASVRAELRASTAPIGVESVVGAAMLSCERAHCRLLLALWDQVEPALRLIYGLHAEAVAVGGGNAAAAFVDASALTLGGGSLTLKYVRKDVADLVRENEVQAHRVLGAGPVSLAVNDLDS